MHEMSLLWKTSVPRVCMENECAVSLHGECLSMHGEGCLCMEMWLSSVCMENECAVNCA